MFRALVLGIAIAITGCSVSALGWRFCLLDNADLTLRIAHPLEDPNNAAH